MDQHVFPKLPKSNVEGCKDPNDLHFYSLKTISKLNFDYKKFSKPFSDSKRFSKSFLIQHGIRKFSKLLQVVDRLLGTPRS